MSLTPRQVQQLNNLFQTLPAFPPDLRLGDLLNSLSSQKPIGSVSPIPTQTPSVAIDQGTPGAQATTYDPAALNHALDQKPSLYKTETARENHEARIATLEATVNALITALNS